MKRFGSKGFTLIELLIVVAIIGIIAAIAIPSVIIAIQRAKQRRTMADMRNIAMAWEARNTDVNRYNAAGGVDGVDALASAPMLASVLTPTYMKDMPIVDGWNNPYAFFTDTAFSSAVPAKRYAIVSGGHDGQISPEVLTGPSTNWDCDIIYSQGVFLAYPDGYGQH